MALEPEKAVRVPAMIWLVLFAGALWLMWIGVMIGL